MSLNNLIRERITLPISDILVGQKIYKQFAFLRNSQWWSQAEMENFQNERLKILIKHAYENVPYYSEMMKENKLKPSDIQKIHDLPKLPVLTKELFKQNYPAKLRAMNWKDYRILYRSSSGSTGTPIQYMMTREGYGFNKACHLRGWYWMGFRLGDRLMKISQNKRNTPEKRIQDKLSNTYLYTQSYSKENLKSFIADFQKFQPEYLRSYPDPLQFIASFLQKENIKLSGLKAINTTGNILFPEIRELIESSFGTKIFDSYSCEGGPNFFECPTHTCYHSSMEYGVSEILNESMEEVAPGKNGRLYTTDLWNFATPFIRYDSKDIVTKALYHCTCGRNLLSITKVIGRDNDVIITPGGKYLIAQTFTTYFKYIPSIIQFQIYQSQYNHVEIRLKVDNHYNSKIGNNILDYWQEYMGNDMKLTLTLLDEIPLAPSGKRRFLLRNPTIQFTI
jgi:phenylacetate-CoA ligase